MSRILAIDIGGTKTLVTLVEAGKVTLEEEYPTPRDADPQTWCDGVAMLANKWQARFDAVGAAVTGFVADGLWSALNPGILPVPSGFPLAAELARRLGRPVFCCNDAQAAAWGEHRHGAGAGSDLFFVTISTGIGGGAIVNGRLLVGRGGLAGSAGLTLIGPASNTSRVEDVAAGRWIALQARAAGHDLDAKGVLEAAEQGQAWAQRIIAVSARSVSTLLANLQLLFDPPVMVLGGGLGLSPVYADRLRMQLAEYPQAQRPDIRIAVLGKYAGVVGAADLAALQCTLGRIDA